MLRKLKHVLKSAEIKLFELLKFDNHVYLHQTPQAGNVNEIRANLIDQYFDRQPSPLAVALIKLYLFSKKVLIKILRTLLGKTK